LAFWEVEAWGSEFYVSTATQLQTALTTAQTNGQDDVIKVAQGTYIGTFIYNSNEGKSITLLGGYTSGFSSRLVDPSNTVLYGTNSHRAVFLYNLAGGHIFLEGFTLIHGNANDGGGGGGVYAFSDTMSGIIGDITIVSNIFIGNSTSGYGGGIYVKTQTGNGVAGDIVITNNIITENQSVYGGAGIFARSDSGSTGGTAGDIIITNNLITNNDSTEILFGGGGIHCWNFVVLGTPGEITITNNTITGNTAYSYGGGIKLNYDNCVTNVYNNIIWGNAADEGGDIYLNGSAISNGHNNDYSDISGSWSGANNNIDVNPLFVGSGNYHLLSISPCIDAGYNSAPDLPSTDFDGDPRIFDGDHNGSSLIDMGADEYTYPISAQLPVFDGFDFDGNGASDISIYRPKKGMWYVKNGIYQRWGASGDIPVQGNYDFDLATEIAVFRPSGGLWFVFGIASTQWGTGGDIPVPHDYDGNGVTDLAVWRPSNGVWYIRGIGHYQWGIRGDIPVPGDYNGDGADEVAVWRPTDGAWYIYGVGRYQWGVAEDIPVPGDYNGDGKTDLAVFRVTSGTWYIKYMGGASVAIHWGKVGDIPVPGDYDGDGSIEIAVWRPSNGLWYIYGDGTFQWGHVGDIPLVR
jgi:hypothetical protein